MKILVGLLAAAVLAGPSIHFFKYQRGLAAADSAGQRFAVVDEAVWQHANADLSDLRLYAGETEIPYVLEVERGGSQTEQKPCRVLQPVAVAGKTQFLLDMSGSAEYDRVTLQLAAKNFVAHARVEGQDDPHGTRWADLGTTTLYDLSAEKLGHNSTLQMPVATYKYLRVTADNSVKPADVQGAAAAITRERQVAWRNIGSMPQQSQQGRDTVVTFAVPENVPVERVVFDVDEAQGNFWRGVEIQDEMGRPLGSGEISRIRMQRGGERLNAEQTSLALQGIRGGTLRAVIRNGDDAPLKISGVHLEEYERRIYFDAAAGVQPVLYYGDRQSPAPVYDYARLFQKNAGASAIALAAEQVNSAFTGRPDERPWSERHPAMLWAAIVAAVLVLGGVAVRSLRASTVA